MNYLCLFAVSLINSPVRHCLTYPTALAMTAQTLSSGTTCRTFTAFTLFFLCCSALDARGGGGRGVFFDRSEMLNADRLFLCLTCNSAVIMMNCPSCHVLKRPAIQFATAGFRSMREVFSFLVPHRKVNALSSCFLYALDVQP